MNLVFNSSISWSKSFSSLVLVAGGEEQVTRVTLFCRKSFSSFYVTFSVVLFALK